MIDPAVAVNVAELAEAATVTDAGMVNAGLVPVSATTLPPAGAAALKFTLQVEDAPLTIVLGMQASEVTIGGANRLNEALGDELFNEAVTVAV